MNPAAVVAAALTLSVPAAAETVTTGGQQVSYRLTGDLAAETPMLVLHGGMMNADTTFGPMIDRLTANRAVIGVDQQGHGRTPLNDQPITLDTMRADTLAVLDALHVGRAHVVGFSMGGMLALDLAVHAPDRVASVTAISASQNPGGFLPDIIRMNREPGFVPPPDIAAMLPQPDDFAGMAKGFEGNPSGPDTMQQTMDKMTRFIGGDWGWTDAQLAAIAAPAQIVIGDHDFIRPQHAVDLAARIPGAWLAILPGTTHMNILARPELPGLILNRIATAEGG